MKVINLSERSSILNHYLAEIRDVNIQGDRMRFRQNIERIGELMAYEISKTIEYRVEEVQTPLGIAPTEVVDSKLVVASIFRAGLAFHQGFLRIFDRADNGFISAYRYYEDEAHTVVKIKTEYCATPELTDKTLLLVDPMLATGESLLGVLESLDKQGRPRKVHIASVIATQEGIEVLKKGVGDRDCTIWCAAIDPILNEHKYIVPGLGDAGDLMYGGKL